MSNAFLRRKPARLSAALLALLLAASPALTQEDKTVATIDGAPITESELSLAENGLGQQMGQLPPDQRRATALSALIEIKLMAAKAAAAGLEKDADFLQQMAFIRLRALHSAYIDKQLAKDITDQEIRARYDQEMAATPPVNEVKARHILVKTKEEALAIIKQLEGGADFQKLANEHTTDPSGKETGGDLGYFSQGQMVPEFEKAAFALEVGTYTKEPVETQFGFHIIKVEDKRQQQPPSFDEVKEQIRGVLLRDKYFATVKSLRDAAKVEISDPALKAAVAAQENPQPAPEAQPEAPKPAQ